VRVRMEEKGSGIEERNEASKEWVNELTEAKQERLDAGQNDCFPDV
jgi:hypothetical protein